MLDRKALQALGCWTGYRLERVEWPQGDSRTLSLYLKPVSQIMYCEQCGARCQQIHETTVRRVRDLPLFEYRVVLHVPRRRVWCERCGAARLEKLDWLGRYQRVTERFAKACEKLLQAASVQAVAAFYELGWHTVKSIDKMRLRARVAEPDWSTIRYLAMDEFALHKGHRYATVVVDPIGRQVLWVGPGRSRETARAFFEQLPEGVAERIEAVAIDMTTAYELEIKEQCPQAEIVFDLYHVVAKYGREVIDRVRVDQANQLRHDKPARLGWHTVKSIDKMRLRARVAEPDWSTIRYLAMDEFALHKGHRYATVVVDPIGRQVLWVGPGRSRETARAFFEQLPEGVAERIEAVAIDMTTAYELEIKEQCPQAEIVFDLYHVVAKYGREVIDRVRVDQANQLRHDKPARKVLKSSRWLLLRNRHNLKPEQAVHLKELLAANQSLLCVYVLRDELKRLWFYRKPACAEKAWGQWFEQAQQSGIAALQKFAQRLQGYWHGIVARCRHPLNTSVVEGINNTIKVIKRRAYGYRDEQYFFLKIRAAFPGIPR
ncbi:transposase family protein [Burkholderia pseudomallei]|nr:transposase family protein [Burkholderia pseudomallei]